jgi:hypothetical protein
MWEGDNLADFVECGGLDQQQATAPCVEKPVDYRWITADRAMKNAPKPLDRTTQKSAGNWAQL